MKTIFKHTYEANISNIIHVLDVLIDSNDNFKRTIYKKTNRLKTMHTQ